jgi:hypothetical protein
LIVEVDAIDGIVQCSLVRVSFCCVCGLITVTVCWVGAVLIELVVSILSNVNPGGR